MTKSEMVIAAAKAQLGSPYVFGAWGSLCTPSMRKKYAQYNPDHKATIYRACPVLSGKQEDCEGCKYEGDLAFDCRGFTYWCLQQVGIILKGAGATSQWNTDLNWTQKGGISDMPDCVCCVFKRNGKVMRHTGLHIGNGTIIHCSSGVQYGKATDAGWTHYAVPAGLYEEVTTFVVMRRGSKGENVRSLQEMLNKLGYNCGDADGVYGQRTETAVKLFQADHLLTEDGVAGEQTQTALAIAMSQTEFSTQQSEDDAGEGILWQAVMSAREALKRAKEAIAEAEQALSNAEGQR